MSAFKEIYRFPVYKNKEVDITIENEDGSKTVRTEVQKVPFNIILKRPNRHEDDEAQLQYSIRYNDLVKRGVMPRRLLEKEFGNNAGIFSEPEKERLSVAYDLLSSLNEEYQELANKADKTEEDKERVKIIESDYKIAQRELQRLETIQNNAYANTAESKSMVHMIVWMTAFLTYVSEGEGEPQPLFKSRTLDAKLDEYEKYLDESDETSQFYLEAYNKATLFINLYVNNNFDTKDFEAIEKNLENPAPVVTE